MVFTDPPYNVPIGGHVSGLGHVQHAEFPMASGEMSEDEFTAFLTTTLEHVRANSADGAIAYVCMDWRHLFELFAAGRAAKFALKNLCVWVKTNAGMGSFYRSQHELIAVFKVGTAPHINSFELGQHGRYRTNVWTYPGVNSFGTRTRRGARHASDRQARGAGRRCHQGLLETQWPDPRSLPRQRHDGDRCRADRPQAAGFELDPRYVDTIIRRWQQMTGKDAVLAATGETFEAVAIARMTGLEEVSHG